MAKNIELSCFYWADAASDLEKDWEHIKWLLDEEGIVIKNLKMDYHPPKHGEFYDVLFFDYGGISMGASGLVEWAINELSDLAENNPSKYYVLTSRFTVDAAEEFDLNYEVKENIFSSVNDFIEEIKKVN